MLFMHNITDKPQQVLYWLMVQIHEWLRQYPLVMTFILVVTRTFFKKNNFMCVNVQTCNFKMLFGQSRGVSFIIDASSIQLSETIDSQLLQTQIGHLSPIFQNDNV